MKWLCLAAILFTFSPILSAQEEDSAIKTKEDSTVFRWGNSKIIVINSSDESKDVKWESNKKSERWNHFAGIDFGINGFLSPANSVSLQKEGEFMDLNYIKSIAIGINFLEFYIPIAKEKFGVLTGLGITFNNYDLARDYTIFSNGDTTMGLADPTKNIKKNKFKSTTINLPILLETNIGKGAKKSFHLAAGGMASYVLGAKTKQKYKINNQEFKEKQRTNFNMNPLRLSAHLRIGYGSFTLFADYSLTPFFDKKDGPELYPFTVGVSLVTF